MAKTATKKVTQQTRDAALKLFRRLNSARLSETETRLCVSRVAEPDYTSEVVAVFINGNGRLAGVICSPAGYILRALVGVNVYEQTQNEQGEWQSAEVCGIDYDGNVGWPIP